jgi:hypothetical protein
MLNEYGEDREDLGMRSALPLLAGAALLGGAAALGLTGSTTPGSHQERQSRLMARDWHEVPPAILVAAAAGLGLITGLLLPRTQWERAQLKRAAHVVGAQVEDKIASDLWNLFRSKPGI